MAAHLEEMKIKTAWDLASADAWTLRKKFSVVEKTARELHGISCLGIVDLYCRVTKDVKSPTDNPYKELKQIDFGLGMV